MKHTPAPWYFRPDDSSVEAQTPTGYNFRVANCADSSVLDLETMKANARLIAAAPDMLEALQELKAILNDLAPSYPPIHPRLKAEAERGADIAEAAIAKATGEQP